jgi:hypothetical protein
VTKLLVRLARNPDVPQTARGEAFALTIRADEQTSFWATGADLADITVVRAVLDIVATEAAPAMARELRDKLTGE